MSIHDTMTITANQQVFISGIGGDLGYYPIGSDCLKQHPELKEYVVHSSKIIDGKLIDAD